VRTEDDAPVADATVNEAFDGLGATFEMLLAAFGRNSLDDAGAPLDATVHYGVDYDNAFWDGERMVFGDGDGEVFRGFTGSLTVIGHELAHGMVQHTANLEYQGQPGALNESVADVFGALTEQYALGHTAAQASWLIGAEIFTDAVEGSALRSMIAPGTAYDDDELGKDPHPTT
jgi:Zn-dependent metalloprotease